MFEGFGLLEHVAKHRTGHDRTEQDGTEQDRTEQDWTGQSRTEVREHWTGNRGRETVDRGKRTGQWTAMDTTGQRRGQDRTGQYRVVGEDASEYASPPFFQYMAEQVQNKQYSIRCLLDAVATQQPSRIQVCSTGILVCYPKSSLGTSWGPRYALIHRKYMSCNGGLG